MKIDFLVIDIHADLGKYDAQDSAPGGAAAGGILDGSEGWAGWGPPLRGYVQKGGDPVNHSQHGLLEVATS